ncbi:MAG: diguanylate cyclase [Gammaproteobacteria bacterium]|jgi:diguanylate cyclase (GGDEF)-like protein|nr:diguanylate cyclase [Gammaproteobacteria bacterium]MBU2179339.1 diguanylate cyclase [Gammaproteobacteria bacterium]MBU2223327.1 diguanylate cyclase [Gammaproteobacteria bacterium]MBU2277848.1 diguanylate cyclase [Gammaproteobacteria bacterium]MBU2426811.1 diguanylate cyclase [Gammaproteobacteria bacterium]
MAASQVKQRVLIIDDQKSNLKILSDILRDEVELILAQDGEQGIRKAIQYTPDLILLDVVMPGIDGFEVIKQLKHDPATYLTPVIFITSLNDVNHEEKGFLLGACDYINKPFHAAVVMARVKLHLQLTRQRRMLEQLANIDPLTAVANRRKYQEVLAQQWRDAYRKRSSLSLVMVDVDNFKLYNDHYGHAAGDRVLQQVAMTLAAELRRPFDFIARYGGEEFVIILPDTPADDSFRIIDGCRQAIMQLQIPHQAAGGCVTISAGGYSCIPEQPDEAMSALALKQADDLLYQAKRQGKNRVLWTASVEIQG